MAHPAPTEPRADSRITVERYFALVDEGALHPDDRVELLEGVVVSMSPQNAPHASGVQFAMEALQAAVGRRAVVRAQMPLMLGRYSCPEPDVAVVPGQREDYLVHHPTTAYLVVEVADSSLLQDRLTKSRIYAAAGIPDYWLVNLPAGRVEVFRQPDVRAARYRETTVRDPNARLVLTGLDGVQVAAGDLLLPAPPPAANG
jgi:Uma2 family endonuclease